MTGKRLIQKENFGYTKLEQLNKKLYLAFGGKGMYRVRKAGSILRNPVKKVKNIKRLNGLAEHESLTERGKHTNRAVWKSLFYELLLVSNQTRILEMMDEFYRNPLFEKTFHKYEGSLTVVCVTKNEIIRVKEFYKHYRALGVHDFLMIDNGSTDGTLEFLMQQDDTSVYTTREIYNSKRKTAWINKAISYHSINRWYLSVDIDEFFVYPEMDRLQLEEYVGQLEEYHLTSVKAMMLEMYPPGDFFDARRNPEDFVKEYMYFDGDPERYFFEPVIGEVFGGFHDRLFTYEKSEMRTKTPLLYYDGKRISIGSHDYAPINEYMDAQYGGILKHYKFLSNEKDKIKSIAQSGIYANGSAMYKKYTGVIEESGGLNPFYEGSQRWDEDAFDLFDFIHPLTRE